MLQNEKYIDFANDNTVEVIAISRLEEGIEGNGIDFGDRACPADGLRQPRADVQRGTRPGIVLELTHCAILAVSSKVRT